MAISAAQCRAARALLDLTQDQLAENAQVARATIADFERNTRMPMRQNMISITSALEAAGVAFIPENGEGAGVRFRKVELEYSRTVRPDGDNIIFSVRYRGQPYSVSIGRAVIDDIDRTNYSNPTERAKAVQNHLPIFLRAVERKIVDGATGDRIVLDHDAFPFRHILASP
jgi:transcriptional regulator with XRE-family HTH domain